MPIENFIIRVYCEVCAAYEIVVKTRLRRRGCSPALSDQEVLALELVGAILGYGNDKAIWDNFVRHWHAWFPALGERTTFVRHAANLWASRCLVETVIGQLTERFQIENNRARDLWHLVSRLYRKVAAHTLCILLSRQLGRPNLQFDGMITA